MTDPAFVTKDLIISDLKELGIRGTVAKYKNSLLPSKLINELYHDKENQELCWLFIASYPNTPSKLLTEISEVSTDIDILSRLAVHPRTPREVLLKLTSFDSDYLLSRIASNRQITPQISERMAKDPNVAVRGILAENPAIFTRIQIMLTQDPTAFIKTTLVLRKELCPEAMDQLRIDSDFLVKAAIITLLNNSENYLLSLADSDRLVDQFLILQNETIPEKVLESLTLSTHAEVRTEAVRKKSLKEDELVGLAKDEEISIRKIIASQPNLPDFVQEIIVNDCEEVQSVLANSFPSPTYAIRMAKESIEIQKVLAENEHIDPKILTFLCENGEDEVVEIVALRNDLSDKDIEIIINNRKNIEAIFSLALNEKYFSDISEEMTLKLSKEKSASLRAFAALSKNLTDESASILLKDPAPLVKEHLIRNPMIEDAELEILTKDRNAKIVKFAQEELIKREENRQKAETPGTVSGVKSFVTNLIDKVRGK